MNTRRGFSVAVIVLILVALHLTVMRTMVAGEDDAHRTVWSMESVRARTGLDSALQIAAFELLEGRIPPTSVTLIDGTEVEIQVLTISRPWSVELRSRSGGSQRSRTVTIG